MGLINVGARIVVRGTAAVLASLYEGRNTGKALVRIRPDPIVREGQLRPASRTSR